MADYDDKPGCGMPIAWVVAAVLVTAIGGAAVGISAAGSESAAVSASYLAVGPIGFTMSGALGALAIHFFVKNPSVRAFLPFGCGCVGAGLFGVGVWAFYTAIWPSL